MNFNTFKVFSENCTLKVNREKYQWTKSTSLSEWIRQKTRIFVWRFPIMIIIVASSLVSLWQYRVHTNTWKRIPNNHALCDIESYVRLGRLQWQRWKKLVCKRDEQTQECWRSCKGRINAQKVSDDVLVEKRQKSKHKGLQQQQRWRQQRAISRCFTYFFILNIFDAGWKWKAKARTKRHSLSIINPRV